MSSILDALKKLESEKSSKVKSRERANIEEVAAERDLTRRRKPQPEGELIRINSFVLVFAGVVLIALLVTVSAVTAVAIMRATEPPRLADAAPPVPAAPPVATAPFRPVDRSVENLASAVPAPEPLQPVSAEPITMEPVESVTPTESAVAAPDPVAWVEPAPGPDEEAAAESPPQPAPQPQPKPAPVVAPPATPPAAQQAPPPQAQRDDTPIGEVNLNTLPMLSETERVRLGLPKLKINMVGLTNDRNPRPSALINFHKVYVGEYINDTKARLIKVELRGVGIEVAGHRYFLEK